MARTNIAALAGIALSACCFAFTGPALAAPPSENAHPQQLRMARATPADLHRTTPAQLTLPVADSAIVAPAAAVTADRYAGAGSFVPQPALLSLFGLSVAGLGLAWSQRRKRF